MSKYGFWADIMTMKVSLHEADPDLINGNTVGQAVETPCLLTYLFKPTPRHSKYSYMKFNVDVNCYIL